MLLKSIVVLVVLVSCQDAFGSSQKANEVRTIITLLREAVEDARIQNFQNYVGLITNFYLSNVKDEKKGIQKIRESINNAYYDLLMLEEEAMQDGYDVTKCKDDAVTELLYFLNNIMSDVNKCSENAENKTNTLLENMLEDSNLEASNKFDDYYLQMDYCISEENESCFNDLFVAVNSEIKVYTKTLQKRFDSIEEIISVYENNMRKCLDKIGIDASMFTEDLLNDMDICIESQMMHYILRE
ncbi:PREDICTED: uncharacterized protein LOC108562979 [Nicrophorus vespilloides]|uniref:Uncharacterized protein LOC108562979 n=1 Tax=Nicrophorus vespilloides TaxID=110193 RepID=A0ABM1MQY5_NICVS|nr:PREDICTED: uncharacterized protein LOC108562979 [Nicrophorus vespilloides]